MTTGPATRAHLLPTGSLPEYGLTVDCGGVVLGVDEGATPVAVQLFRSTPTQLVLVTAGFVARLVAMRALAAGAALAVTTSRPQDWHPVISCVPAGHAMLTPPGGPFPTGSGPNARLLRCDDLGPGSAGVRTEVGPWQTRLAVQDFTPSSAVPALRAFDVVVVQRLRPDLVRPLQQAFALPDDVASALPRMPDDMVALIAPGRSILVRLSPTEIERSLLGDPVRHDG